MFSFSRSIIVFLALLLFGISFTQTSQLAQEVCPGTPVSIMTVGIRGRVTFTDGSATSLRAQPTTSSERLMRMPEGFAFDVIGGPVCADGYNFWQLETNDSLVGWAAEGAGGSYWIEPMREYSVTNSLPEFSDIQLDRSIYYFQDRSAFVYNVDDQMTSTLVTLSEQDYPSIDPSSCPKLSPSGRYLAFATLGGRFGTEIVILDITTMEELERLDNVSKWVDWSPNDDILAYGILEHRVGGPYSEEPGIWIYSISEATKEVLFRPWAEPLDGETLTKPDWSPLGNYMAFERARVGTGGPGPVTIGNTVDSTIETHLFASAYDWSPAGEQFVFEYNRRIFVSNLDGTDQYWLIGDSRNPVTAPRWSPDGRFIAFGSAEIYDGAYGGFHATDGKLLDLATNTIHAISDQYTIPWSTPYGLLPAEIGEVGCAEWWTGSTLGNTTLAPDSIQFTPVTVWNVLVVEIVNQRQIENGIEVEFTVGNPLNSLYLPFSFETSGNLERPILDSEDDMHWDLIGLIPPKGILSFRPRRLTYRVAFTSIDQQLRIRTHAFDPRNLLFNSVVLLLNDRVQNSTFSSGIEDEEIAEAIGSIDTWWSVTQEITKNSRCMTSDAITLEDAKECINSIITILGASSNSELNEAFRNFLVDVLQLIAPDAGFSRATVDLYIDGGQYAENMANFTDVMLSTVLYSAGAQRPYNLYRIQPTLSEGYAAWPPVLLYPLDFTVATSVIFEWSGRPEVTSYQLQLATQPDFEASLLIVDEEELVGTSFDMSELVLDSDTDYFWRVKACYLIIDGCSVWSSGRFVINES